MTRAIPLRGLRGVALPSILGSSLFLVLGHSATAWAQTAAPAPAAPAPIAPAPPAPPGAAAPKVAAPTPAAEPQAAPVRRAVVSFQADDPSAVLESDASTDGKTSPWYVVCQSPCEKEVLANGNFRVAGSGFYPSRQFVLPEGRDRVVVNAEMKESSVALPITLTIVGYGLFSVVAPIFVIVGAVQEAQQDDGTGMFVAGGVSALTGAVMGTTGLVMLIIHAQDKESKAFVAKKQTPGLALPGGLVLDQRGVAF